MCFNATLSIHPTSPSPPILYVCVSIPALQIGFHQYYFLRFHKYSLIYDICFSLSDFTLYNRLYIHPPYYNWLKCVPFHSWVIFHCIYVPQLLYPFICWWNLGCFHVLAIVSSVRQLILMWLTSVTKWGIWDLAFWPGIKSVPPALEGKVLTAGPL